MKELTIEEKAKAYDEAVERARIWKDKSGMPKDKQGILDDIFPELKESEDDRIRKWLIELVEEVRKANPTNVEHNGMCSEALAWIEKQAEHANFRSKIQIGDKVTRNRDGVLVNLSQLNRVAKVDEKQSEQKPNYCHHEVDLSGCSEEYCKAYYDGWNNCNQQHAQLEAEQKPAWSEENERHIDTITSLLKDRKKEQSDWGIKVLNEEIAWLKSIKDRYIPQSKHEWSEEDESRITTMCIYLQDYARLSGSESRTIRINEYCDWLKSLRPQNRWKPSDEQIKVLEELVEDNNQRYFYTILRSLYEQLKKLREE